MIFASYLFIWCSYWHLSQGKDNIHKSWFCVHCCLHWQQFIERAITDNLNNNKNNAKNCLHSNIVEFIEFDLDKVKPVIGLLNIFYLYINLQIFKWKVCWLRMSFVYVIYVDKCIAVCKTMTNGSARNFHIE